MIGTVDERAAELVGRLYDEFDCPKLVMSLRNAEFMKYASNALLATLISFSNEMAALCEALPGADVEIVMDGLHLDKRLSPMVGTRRVHPGILSYLRPSSGYGGSCLPKDVAALLGFAREKQVSAPLLQAVALVNERRPGAVLDLAEQRIGKFKDAKVGVLGLAFKSGTDDLRNSPAVLLVQKLVARGAFVTVYDPFATDLARPILDGSVTYATDPLSALKNCDVAVIGTGWPEWRQLDWSEVRSVMRGRTLFDARNSLRSHALPDDFVRLQIGSGG